jgi:glc operon protein GlcG
MQISNKDLPMRSMKLAALLCVVTLFIAGSAFAQQMPNSYGPNINLAATKKIAAAAAAKAVEMNVNAVIAIADTGGHLVYLERFDVVQWGSIDVATHKAKASVQYKRPTLALENVVKSNITYLTLDGITAIEGGVPIIQDGKIIGAIGVSGGSSVQDGQIAGAGAAVMK